MYKFSEFITEEKISFSGSKTLDVDTLETQLKKQKEVDIHYEDGKTYFIPPYLHVNGDLDIDDDAEEFPAYNEKGKKNMLRFDKVNSIE